MPVDRAQTWAEARDFERANHLLYLGAIAGRRYFLPAHTTLADLEQAADMLSDKPADAGAIRISLYELWLTTKTGHMATEDRNDMLGIYAKRLAEFPADLVALVLGEISRASTFFPAWSEIEERIAAHTAARTALLAAMRNIIPRIGDTRK